MQTQRSLTLVWSVSIEAPLSLQAQARPNLFLVISGRMKHLRRRGHPFVYSEGSAGTKVKLEVYPFTMLLGLLSNSYLFDEYIS